MMKPDTEKNIKDMFQKLNDRPNSFPIILKEKLLGNLTDEDKKEYEFFEQSFIELKKKIEEKSKTDLLAAKIKKIKESGQDRLLTNAEQALWADMLIFMERQVLVVNLLRKISNKEVKLSEIEDNFDKYTLANFYRSFCELSPRILSNAIFEITNYLLLINHKEKKEIIRIKKAIEKNRLMLNDIRLILGYFDKDTGLKIEEIFNKVYLFKEGEGFSLRNRVAHDRELFIKIDNNLLVSEIQGINKFIQAFLLVFYLNELGNLAKPKDLNLVKKLFKL